MAVSHALKQLSDAFSLQIKTCGSQGDAGLHATQKAMPTTVGAALGAYQDAFTDASALVTSTYKLIDQNPLGSAAGLGVALPLNRAMTTWLRNYVSIKPRKTRSTVAFHAGYSSLCRYKVSSHSWCMQESL